MSGTNTVNGGLGNDTINVTAGTNYLHFKKGDGNDIILNNSGQNTIIFDDNSYISQRESGNNLIITYGSSETITIRNYTSQRSNFTIVSSNLPDNPPVEPDNADLTLSRGNASRTINLNTSNTFILKLNNPFDSKEYLYELKSTSSNQTATVEFDSWPKLDSLEEAKKSVFARRFATPKEEFFSRMDKMAQVLASAKKPVIFTGGGCASKEVSVPLSVLLGSYECAVVSSLMGLGSVPSTAENHFGMVGMHGSVVANRAIHDADVVLALGVRFDDRATGVIGEFCPNAKILHIDVDAAEINKILPSYISLVGDLEEVLPFLRTSLAPLHNEKIALERLQWISELKKLKSESFDILCGRCSWVSPQTINPRAFIKNIPQSAEKAGVSKDDLIITTDVGQHQMWTAQYYPVEKPRTFLTSGSLGTMGFGLPCAIGAALVEPKKRVVCISGDGSILMNIQELATLKELNLNVTVIVLQNGSLGMVRQQQMYLFDKNYSASEFAFNPDFLRIAEGFGIDGVDALSDGWEQKAFSQGPHFVVLKTDRDDNVLPFVKAGSANIDAIVN